MSKGKSNNDEVIIDLLQKLLIIELTKAGVTRDEIKVVLNIGSDKVSSIYKFFSKKGGKENGK